MVYASCHPDRPSKAKGLCQSCYTMMRKRTRDEGRAMRRGPTPEIAGRPVKDDNMPRLEKPEVLQHVATAIVMSQLDVEKAVDKMLPTVPASDKEKVIEKLAADPRVHEAVQQQLEADGLDERSRNVFVRRMWEWLENGMSPRHQLKAAAILGKGFIGEKIIAEVPQSLPIAGFEAGLAEMMGEVNADTDEPEKNSADIRKMN